MLYVIKIIGSSLEPAFGDGDYVLASRIPLWLRGIRAGDVVIFQHPAYGRLIKLVQQVDRADGAVTVTGLSPGSVDSRQFGPIQARDVSAAVIGHIRKSG